MTVPVIPAEKYNQTLQGVYGEFGSGANAQICFLQTGLNPASLGKIALISDIKGSEAWPVRDLFQREVDTRRVTSSILPYLQTPEKVKFFNPLTLTLLPIDEQTNQIITAVPFIDYTAMEDENGEWICLEYDPFYRYKYLKHHHQYGILEWNDARVKIVAIDGQHRLSALKRFERDVAVDPEKYSQYMKWTIPIVIFGLRVIDESQLVGTILDVMRNVFVYINTQAKTPNRARTILLSDESINDICTQELLQYSHDNDIQEPIYRSDEILPLLFYDWRGEEVSGTRLHSPSYIKTIEEINDFLRHYLLQEDFSSSQEIALEIQPTDPLHTIFVTKRLDPLKVQNIRERFREKYIPGLSHFFENFKPYKSYAQELRKFEKRLNEESDVSRHAFYQLRFGSNIAGEDLQPDITTVYDEIVRELIKIKDDMITGYIDLDIGARGIMCALSEFRQYVNKTKEESVPWIEYCEWFTNIVNEIYDASWFDMSEENREIEGLLRHITVDHNGNIVNYRFGDISDALGAILILLISAYGKKSTGIPNDEVYEEILDLYLDNLSNTLLKGYKKQVRAMLRMEGVVEKTPEYKQRLKKDTEKFTKNHIKKLEKFLNKIE